MDNPDVFVNEESELKPVSLYAETKVEFERYLLGQDKTVGTKPTCLRFSTVYGLSPRIRFDLTVNEFTKELVLDRDLSDKRIYPSININRSSTRREDKLIGKKDLSRIWLLRKIINDMTNIEAMEFLIEKLKRTKHNREFLDSMSS